MANKAKRVPKRSIKVTKNKPGVKTKRFTDKNWNKHQSSLNRPTKLKLATKKKTKAKRSSKRASIRRGPSPKGSGE